MQLCVFSFIDIQRLQKLRDEDRLLTAGPMPSVDGTEVLGGFIDDVYYNGH